jgi:signal transduction histidine kinase
LATASPFDAALRDVLDRLHSASSDLEGARDATEVAQRAAEAALALTRSAQAVVALGGVGHELDRYDRFFARGGEGAPPPTEDEVAGLLAAAGLLHHGDRSRHDRVRGSVAGALLRTHGQVIGGVAVSRAGDYSETERVALEVFASQVATALASSSQWDEMWQSVERVERAHELAVQVLTAVSSQAVKGENLNDFYSRLARTVGELVGANRVVLWRLDDHTRMLAPIPDGYRIDPEFLSRLKPVECEPERSDLTSQVVFHDLIFRASNKDEPPEHGYVLEILGVSSAINVPWRAGDERLGLIAAYDSTRPDGFSREDGWVLQKAGLAAGLVTRLRQAQDDLRRSVERLTKVDSARQLLLRNMTAVVEKERQRVVAELHDDALQKLTAAELELARLEKQEGGDAEALEKVRELLEQTESSLRRLVFDVRPPALESPDGLAQSIQDRAAMLTSAGIKPVLDLDLPRDMSLDTTTLLFRQVAEAIGNVERHSHATEVTVSLHTEDGGVHGVIRDNGQGFDVAERSNLPGHLGLLALRERALMAGGRYSIESNPGEGTTIEFWIPVGQ